MTVLPQLKEHIRDAAAAHLPAPDHGPPAPVRRQHQRRRTLRAIGASVPIALSVGVAIVIAAVALIVIRHGNSSHPSASAGTVASSGQELVQALGALRTPQTKSDLDPVFVQGFLRFTSRYAQRHRRLPTALERWLARMGYPKLDRSLARVVHLPAWHAKVGLEPATFQPSPSSPQRVEGLDLELWIGSSPTIPPSTDIGTGPRPTSVGTLLAHGLTLATGVRGTNMIDGVMVVPDGVARITLRPTRLVAPPVTLDPSRFGTASATVHDNIAAFQLPIPSGASRSMYSGEYGIPAVAQAVWYDATGNVVKRTTTNVDLLVNVRGRGPRPGPPGPARLRRLRTQFCRQNPHAC